MKKVFGQTVRDLKREVNKKVLKVAVIEQKILDATNNESWGPHGSHLADIAQATQNYHEYQLIMSVIWKRINDTGKNWRHVYKGLIILEYLVVNGSERVIEEIRQHAHQISTLSDFQYIDSSGKDQGVNVRKKSQSLVSLVSSKERIQEVRGKASVYQEKYHIKDDDHNGYGKGQSRSHPGSYDNYDIQSGNDDHHFGQKTSNSDIVKDHSVDANDDRQLEHKFTEQNIVAPPSYEEATKDAQNDIHTERDVETLTYSPQEKASPSKPKLTSSAESTNQEASVKFDPCGSDSAAPHIANEMDLFGSFTDDSTNSSFPLPTTSNTTVETDLTSILGFNNNFAAPSSVSSVPNKLSEDPFGDSPFKALPQEDGITQPQKETSLSLTQPSFKSIDTSKSLPLSGTTPTVENYSGFAFENSSNNGVNHTLSSVLNGQPASTTSELFVQDLPVAQSNNDILGDIFPQIGSTIATFSEAAPAPTSVGSQTTTSSLFMQASLSDPTNPFTQSGISSEEASPNPFIQSSVSSQATLPNSFVKSSLSLQAPSNPFAESGLSMQDAPPNPFAQSSLATQVSHSNPFAQSASSVSIANYATHSGLPSNGFPPSYITQSGLSSSKSDTNLAKSGSLASVASQGFPPNHVAQSGLLSSKSAMNLVESGLLTVVASQGISPDYMAQSGLSLQATTNLTQLGLSALATSSQGLPSNDIAQSELSSQATPNFSQSGLTDPLATQVSPPDNITLSSQAAPNLIQSGLTTPLAAHGLHPDRIAQPRLSSQTTPNVVQSGLIAPLSTQGFPQSDIAQSGLSSQATPTLAQSGLPASQGFPQTYIVESGLSSQTSSNTPVSGLPAPLASQGLPQTYIIQSGLSSQTPSSTALSGLPSLPISKGLPANYVAQTGLSSYPTPNSAQSGLTTASTLQATPSTTTASLTKIVQPKEKFEPKSTVWADTLSRGLVNLDISGAKTNPLADIGIDFDSINRKEKMKEEKNTSTPMSTVTMGKAMGSGSGVGRVGATGLAPPPNPIMGSGMGMGGFGGIDGYSGGMNQPMGMGMGLNVGIGMGQSAAMQPGFGMPPGSGVAPHPGMPGTRYNQMMDTNDHGYQRPYGGGYN